MSESNIIPMPGTSMDPVALLAQMVATATGDAEVIESNLPVPPNGASPRAQATWYAVLKEHGDLGIARMQLLESIVENVTQYDLVKDRWVADGSPTISHGSMGQEVESPALGTMKNLRTQEAALWKQVDLPGGGVKRRPGRPTRAEAAERGRTPKWGTR